MDLRHVVFVHAHPDDETISTGGTIATLVDAGVAVTVLTCTRGERGEVIPAELQHLEGDGEALAAVRERELEAAMGALGVTDQRFLGQPDARAAGRPPRRYTDSGMVWGIDGRPRPVDDVDADSLCAAPIDEVVGDIEAVLTAVTADAVISYDRNGGYGHPDHVRAQEAARAAAERAGVAFHEIIEDAEELAQAFAAATPAADVTLVDARPVLGRKIAALRAHATQVTVIEAPPEPARFALSNGHVRAVEDREALRLDTGSDPAADSGDLRAETPTSKVATALVSLVIGILVGILLTINHQHRVTIADVGVPLGLIGALAIVTALLVGMRLVFASRLVALATAVGIVGVTALLSQEGPGGSVLVPATVEGVVWVYAPMVIAVVVLAWPKLPSSREGRMEAQPRQEGSSL